MKEEDEGGKVRSGRGRDGPPNAKSWICRCSASYATPRLSIPAYMPGDNDHLSTFNTLETTCLHSHTAISRGGVKVTRYMVTPQLTPSAKTRYMVAIE